MTSTACLNIAEETRLCRSATPTCCSTIAEAAVEQFAGHELQRVVRNAFEPVAKTFTHFEETFSGKYTAPTRERAGESMEAQVSRHARSIPLERPTNCAVSPVYFILCD